MSSCRYKGYEIEVSKEKCQEGYVLTYFYVFRESDGLEVVSNFTSAEEDELDLMDALKDRVDVFIKTQGRSELLEDAYAVSSV